MRSEPGGTEPQHTDPTAAFPDVERALRRRCCHQPAMHRVPLTLRALLLVPLLAVAVDQARAGLVCGSRAETCLQVAGQGWLGGAGIALLVVYSLAAALLVARLARGDRRPTTQPASLMRLWVVASSGVAAVCGGQALLARAFGAPGALGGGWTVL